MQNIQLLGIAPSGILKHECECISPILSDFISTLNELNKNGLTLRIKGKDIKYFGFLAFTLGDTLAQNWLAGFFESVGKTRRFCRNCEITYDERKNGDFSSKYESRKLNSHLDQLSMIDESPSLSKFFGIKSRSELLKIKDFDVCQSFLQDPMHTLIQGVCLIEMKYLFIYFIEEKKIKLNFLNEAILSFNYPLLDKDNKPNNLIQQNHIDNASFSLNASQILTLILNFPLIMGDLFFQNEDENWKNFLRLNEIVNLVFAFFYDKKTIETLDSLIHKYLNTFKLLYNDASITPKMHFLTHFPAQMENFGPLRHHHCFRFEAKNGLMLEMINKNFIDVGYSIANNHQFWIACKQNQLKKQNFSSLNDFCKIEKRVEPYEKFALDLRPISFLSVCKSLKKDGFKYYKSYLLVLNDDFVFGDSKNVAQIVELLNCENKFIFYCEKLKLIRFVKYNNSFELAKTGNYFYLKYEELIFKQPNFVFNEDNNNLFMQLRYFHRTFND